jgi:drug/metabolite transporter (DMT)-like permease
MFYIGLAVITGVLVLVAFKLFPRFGVSTFSAILFNYLTAAVTGILFLDSPFSVLEISNAAWLGLSLPLGALFISIFYLISLTVQRISLSTASVANKMSVAMPVLFSVFFLGQDLSDFKLVGVALALLAVYFSTTGGSNPANMKKLFWLPLLVFIGSGLIDVSINAGNGIFKMNDHHSALFTITTFTSAFCCGLLVFLYLLLKGKTKPAEFFGSKNIFAGICLGIPNYFSIYFIFRALDTQILNSVQLFPVLNLSNVVLAALIGRFFFGEKLSRQNMAGILLAVLSILLISL